MTSRSAQSIVLTTVTVVLFVILYNAVWKPVRAQMEAVRTTLCQAANTCEDQQ
jgi:type II secretory pathway component PulM